MNWLPFVLSYAIVTLTLSIGLHFKGVLRLDSAATVRALVAASALLLLGELLAEERGLWLIPAHSGIYFFKTPFESIILIVATTLNSLQIYILTNHFLGRQNGPQT